jgi:hypothetical protein
LKNALTTKLTNYLILSVLTFAGVHVKLKFPVELSAANPETGWAIAQRALALRWHCPVLYSNDIYVYIPFYCRE